MVTLLSIFCLVLFGVLVTVNAERNYWKKQYEDLLNKEPEKIIVCEKAKEPEKKPDPVEKPKKTDNREYFLITDKRGKKSDSLVDWFSSSDL